MERALAVADDVARQPDPHAPHSARPAHHRALLLAVPLFRRLNAVRVRCWRTRPSGVIKEGGERWRVFTSRARPCCGGRGGLR